jgi:2-methylcitrate dehydratase PrpD
MTVSGSSTGETRRLAAFCADLELDDLDTATRTAAERSVADLVAACYAGTGTEAGHIAVGYAHSLGGDGATVLGGGDALAHVAALANGTTAHGLDVDDGHRAASAHPGATVIPAALAAAEKHGSSGADLLVAVVAGYEAAIRTAVSVQTSHRKRGFHATATVGCLGAAAAVGSILDFDAAGMADALGLGGTQAGGLFEFMTKGSMSKRFHAGRAAMAGVLAGELAAEGVDGPDTIIEGDDGFAPAFADEYDLSHFENLGDPFAVTEAYLKPYPSCRHVHGPMEAAFELRERIPPERVESIRVETYESAAKHDKRAVENLLDAQMSGPYSVAVAWVTGAGGLAQYDPPIDDPTDRRLAERTTFVAADDMEAAYPSTRPARVVVETTDGGSETVLVEFPLGSKERPLGEADLREKFHDLVGDRLPADRRERVLDAALSMSSVEDVASFAADL